MQAYCELVGHCSFVTVAPRMMMVTNKRSEIAIAENMTAANRVADLMPDFGMTTAH